MKGYICPVCFFRILYSESYFSKCNSCNKITNKRHCENCSCFKRICRNCGLLIRDGKSYLEALDNELEILKENFDVELCYSDKIYVTLSNNIKVWKKIIRKLDQTKMLAVCEEKY